jgi:hypothetical protein
MGLSPKFKQFLAACHPECLVPEGGAARAVVIDVMVTLHSHTVHPDDEHPALWLAQTLWYAIEHASVAALCFDVSATTPVAKSIEWAARPAPEVVVTVADVEAALAQDKLPHFPSLIASRGARAALCKWLVRKMAARLSDEQALVVFDDGVPTVYRAVAGVRTSEARPDLARTLHGEADVSAVFAAHVLHSEFGAPSVQVCTVDTDIVLIACLSCFEGLLVRLQHFDHKTRLPVYMTVDCARLAADGPARYRLTLPEWATLVMSRGTDYVHGGVIKGVGDWDVYLRGCADALRDVKASRGRELVTPHTVDAGALHTTFVAASARMKRAALKYERDDGTMARLAWNVLYFTHAPLRGGEGLDCTAFGWRVEDGGKVACARASPAATYGLGGA